MRWLSLAALGVLAALAGCAGKPVDPLAPDRARLLALDEQPLADGWPSQATLFVGGALLAAQLQVALDDLAAAAANGPGLETPFGSARVTPRPRVEGVRVLPSTSCQACVQLVVTLGGEVGLTVEGALLARELALPFTASAKATLSLALVDEEARRRVLLRAVQGGEWDVDAELSGLPPMVNATLSQALAKNASHLVEEGLLPELPLADVPQGGPVRLRGMRATTLPVGGEGDHVVAVELSFATLEAGRVTSAHRPDDGFLVVIPAETLLGLARAAALRMPPRDGHVAEPRAIVVDGERYTLDVRVWRIAPEPEARDFRAEGSIVVDGGVLTMKPSRVSSSGGLTLDPVELFVRTVIEGGIAGGLSAMIPARREDELFLGRRLGVELVRVEGKGGLVLLYGRAALLRPEGA